MNWKTGVDRLKSKYRISAFAAEVKQIDLTDKELFMLLAEQYARIANKHKLIMKYSTDNTTPQTNLTVGTNTYTSGTGATNIPNDIRDIYAVTLNDADKTGLDRLNISSLHSTNIGSGIPSGFAIDKTNKILVLNAVPQESYSANSAMRLIIHYTQLVEPYTGTPCTLR